MRSTLEQSALGASGRSSGVLLAVLAISRRGTASDGEQGSSRRLPRHAPALAQAEVACAPGEVAIAPTDVGIGDAIRCLPVAGAEVQGSRVDPLYGQIAASLLERISGRTADRRGSVKVICWSKVDWRKLTVAFRDAGQMEPLRYWLGWTRGKQRVINLSYPACMQLDGIAYRNMQLALQPRAPPLAHSPTKRCTSQA